jgi:RHS repeat-associated protein
MGVADSNGVLIEKLYYNSTGLMKSYDASGVENLGSDGNNLARSKYIPFGWTGMRKDRFTGLYVTHFRSYSAIHGRWLSEDPAGYRDGLNLYAAYMGVNGVDPLGLGFVDKVDAVKVYLNSVPLEGWQGFKYSRNPWSVPPYTDNQALGYIHSRGLQIAMYESDTAKDIIQRIRDRRGSAEFFETHEHSWYYNIPVVGAPDTVQHLYWNIKGDDKLSASGNVFNLASDAAITYGGLKFAARFARLNLLSVPKSSAGLVDDSLNLASKSGAYARKGKYVADDAITFKATRLKGTQQAYKVYQRTNISWNRIRTAGDKRFIGKTNLEAAQKGLAPQLADGHFATLHHLGQKSQGALVEASTRYHGVGKYGQDILHSQYGRNMPHPTSPINRKMFNVDTREYWQWRVGH